MKKLLFGIVATALFSVSSFANVGINPKTENQKTIVTNSVENSNDKFKATYNLGNVSNLTESQLNSLFNNITTQIGDVKNVDECTITLTAEVNVVFGSVSVSVSYTAANCETAMKKAGAALSSAVRKVRELAAAL